MAKKKLTREPQPEILDVLPPRDDTPGIFFSVHGDRVSMITVDSDVILSPAGLKMLIERANVAMKKVEKFL